MLNFSLELLFCNYSLSKDKPKALKRDSIYNIDMLFWKKGFQTFIYIYYKSFDIHICSTRTGFFTHSVSIV